MNSTSPSRQSLVPDDLIRKRVLVHFPVGNAASIERIDGGLINRTFLVADGDRRFVLQWVNPVFPASIHDNIRAVTDALARAGMVTPRLVETTDGRPCLELPPRTAGDDDGDDDGDTSVTAPSVWRLMTHVDGVSFGVAASSEQARAAGQLVARFHKALDGLPHPFSAMRAGVHDTSRHIEHLRLCLGAHAAHGLFPDVAPLADAILGGVASMPALPPLPARVCHGDLKFNNLLFAGAGPPDRDRAICLVDLDTVGPMALAYELGDAWRSWCNRSGENQEVAELDLSLFEASLDGYRAGLARELTSDERRALLLGPEWISLELAARFAADALAESYFGWDATRFPTRGAHNLTRARGQWSLHEAFAASRAQRARTLGVAI